ncbi:HD domain-containing protein [bacterium]|nr:HD domain-containing protein [bacterium]
MIRKALLLKIFDAAYMQRWNDKMRPVDLIEMDKQAHKMVIAYLLGKFEEDKSGFDWINIVEGGIFELFQRLVITDLKPPVFYKIKQNSNEYKRLREWVYKELESIISPLGPDFCRRFAGYFSNTEEDINKRILNAAHFYATKWEFDIIKRANPEGYEIDAIDKDLRKRQEQYQDLTGISQLYKNNDLKNFIDLCGQLRFQTRWSHLSRTPKTSVIGHMLFVAILSYLFSLEMAACKRRCLNNYFSGLFHDLPEVLTRDIISPVKRAVEGISDLIKEYEKEQMQKEVYGLIPKEWHPEIRMFTENEFDSIINIDGNIQHVTSDDINKMYNDDRFNPRDGKIIKAADDLAAFIESYVAIRNGSTNQDLHVAKLSLKNKYGKMSIAGINMGEIYADFD